MKNTMLSIGLAGLTTVLLSSFVGMQKSGETQEQKKTRHIRMIKTENGKTMELDTVLNGDDVFVWNGDTVNPVKHIAGFGRELDRRNGNGLNFRHRGGEPGKPAFGHMPSRDRKGSGGDRMMDRRRMKDDPGNNMFYFNDPGMQHFSPVPSLPPVPHMGMRGIQHQEQIINLNDPNIISFEKKKMSGDREKIEIIRKKSDDNKNSTFNYRFDHQMMPPGMPEFNWKSDGDSLQVKIIEKKKVIKAKNGKEKELKIDKEENK